MEDDRSAVDFIEQKKNSAAKAKNILRTVMRLPRSGNRVLHVGCGGECNEAIPRAYQAAGFVNYGVDAVRSYVQEFGAVGEAQLANASALPYADETFDVVNFTDILEHLFDPLAGLREASRVLKKNGLLVLETPNRMYLQRKNPCSWLEYFLGRLSPGLLRPRIITARWAGRGIVPYAIHPGRAPNASRSFGPAAAKIRNRNPGSDLSGNPALPVKKKDRFSPGKNRAHEQMAALRPENLMPRRGPDRRGDSR